MAMGKLVKVYDKRTRLYKKKRGRPTGSKKKAPTIKQIDKKVNQIIRGIEKEDFRKEGQTNMTGSTSSFLDEQIFSINPCTASIDTKGIVITKGDNEGQRQGNQVTTQRRYFKFCVTLNPWNSGTNPNPKPMILKAMIVSVRGGVIASTLTDIEGLLQSRFFDTGSGYTGFSDSPYDLLRPINNDVFTVHKSFEYRLGNATYMASGAGGATPTSNQGFSNNFYNPMVMDTIDLTEYCHKNIKWNDDDTINYNSNKWLVFTLTNIDGTQIGSGQPAVLWYNNYYKYTDA